MYLAQLGTIIQHDIVRMRITINLRLIQRHQLISLHYIHVCKLNLTVLLYICLDSLWPCLKRKPDSAKRQRQWDGVRKTFVQVPLKDLWLNDHAMPPWWDQLNFEAPNLLRILFIMYPYQRSTGHYPVYLEYPDLDHLRLRPKCLSWSHKRKSLTLA